MFLASVRHSYTTQLVGSMTWAWEGRREIEAWGRQWRCWGGSPSKESSYGRSGLEIDEGVVWSVSARYKGTHELEEGRRRARSRQDGSADLLDSSGSLLGRLLEKPSFRYTTLTVCDPNHGMSLLFRSLILEIVACFSIQLFARGTCQCLPCSLLPTTWNLARHDKKITLHTTIRARGKVRSSSSTFGLSAGRRGPRTC